MIDVATCFGNELCWSCRELTTAEGKGNFKRVPIFISVSKSREKVVEQWDPNIWLAAFSVRLVKYAKPFTRRPIFHYSFTRGHAPIKEKHCSFSWKFLTCPPNNWVINIANLQFSINTQCFFFDDFSAIISKYLPKFWVRSIFYVSWTKFLMS